MLFATPVSQIVICDTTLRSRQTPQSVSKLPRVCRHGVRLPLKLSLSQNGPVLEEICGILVQPKKVQNGCEHKPYLNDIARRSSRAPRLDQDYDGIVSVRCGYQIAPIPRVDSRQVGTWAQSTHAQEHRS